MKGFHTYAYALFSAGSNEAEWVVGPKYFPKAMIVVVAGMKPYDGAV